MTQDCETQTIFTSCGLFHLDAAPWFGSHFFGKTSWGDGMQGLGLLIDGALVAGDERLAVINPATAAVFAEAPRASAAQLDRAVDAAGRAFGAWAARPLADRRGALLDAADAMERRM